MNDDTTLSAVRDCLSEARDYLAAENISIPASVIIARARRRRLRRGVSAAATTCGALALAVILALALASGGQRRPVHAHLAAAWSVDSNSNGTVTITIQQLTHAAQLEQALAQAGVPAIVTPGVVCLNTQNQDALDRSGALHSGQTGVVVTPSAIPPGTKLLFSVFNGPGGFAFGWGLVSDGAPLHCVTIKAVYAYPSPTPPTQQP